LDEPLGALDRRLREATQFELVNIQESLGLTFVIVTHDQEEAMTVSTRLAVMNEGRLAQMGEPQEIYEAPASRYVAEFIGDVNVLEGRLSDGGAGHVALDVGGVADLGGPRDRLGSGALALALRPEKIAIERLDADTPTPPNALDGTVRDIGYLGDMSIYHVALPGGASVRVARTNRFRALEQPITWETPVRLSWDAKSLVVLGPDP
ncbi:MAG: ABC transporter ATP-binding protein, partial [Pseudomonadota bacterium]